ncbi:MAG: ABC transporter substrate-binding protein [Deltaproteobacteria bacterium]|nr:ABC transporter substrate-binding protein [Deltaproteobacteria bacterium]
MKRLRLCIVLLGMLGLFVGLSPVGAQAQKAAPAGTVNIAISTLHEETFLPWNGGGPRKFYLDNIYEYLFYVDPATGKAIPGLAKKWKVSPDGKTWTFTLRKGVPFHEGWGEVTSADVKYSIEQIVDPKSVVGPAGQMRKLIAKVEAPDPYTVVFQLTRADAEFDFGYMGNSMCAPICCKKYVETVGDEKANAHPIGTGAYTLTEYKKGSSMTFTTVKDVEKHWRVTPKFKTIKILAVPEEATRVAMLKAGEVDLAPISYDSVDTVKASGLHILPGSFWAPLIRFGGIVATDPKRYIPNIPWAKKEVRQALNYAIDRDAIVKNIFHGSAVPSFGSISSPLWNDIPAYPYDPEKAKQLLKQAGYPNGFKVTLKVFTTTPGAELPLLGQTAAMYWQNIGLDVTVIPTDWGTVRSEWSGGKMVPDYVWTHRGLYWSSLNSGLMVETTSKTPFSSYATKESEALFDKMATELDAKKRAKLAVEMGEFLREEAFCVGLVHAYEPHGVSKKITAWPTNVLYPNNLDQLK